MERIEEGRFPPRWVPGRGEPVVDGPPNVIGRVTTAVVAGQEVRKDEIAPATAQLDRVADRERRVQHRDVTPCFAKGVRAALVEQLGVLVMRAWPDPQIACLGLDLVGEQHPCEEGEGFLLVIPGGVIVDVRATRDVAVGRNGCRDLDVTEAVIEGVGSDQLLGDLECR